MNGGGGASKKSEEDNETIQGISSSLSYCLGERLPIRIRVIIPHMAIMTNHRFPIQSRTNHPQHLAYLP